MAIVTGELVTYSTIGRREDLEDTIWDLFPMDTYLVSNLDKVDATGTFHEWLNDGLEAATLNAQLEGDDASYASVAQAVRMGNYTQISRKAFTVSGTVEAVKKAGRKSEITRQLMKQMKEWKRDVEKALCGRAASSAGSQNAPRTSGGMESWIASTDHGGNGIRATSTVSFSTVGFSSGVVTAPADGVTASASTLVVANLTAALTEAWTDGGDPRVIITGAFQRAIIDGFTSIATRFVDVDAQGGGGKGVPIIGSAGVYMSDFGKHVLILSRYVRTNQVLCIDPDYWAQAWLRRPTVETLAKTGDGEKRMIIGEFCLVARNPESSAKIGGLKDV